MGEWLGRMGRTVWLVCSCFGLWVYGYSLEEWVVAAALVNNTGIEITKLA